MSPANDQAFDPSGPAGPDAGIFGLNSDAAEAGLVLVPAPFDATTSYGHGASRAPAAILAASHQVELFDRQFGRPYEQGIALLEAPQAVLQWNERASAAVRRAREGKGDRQAAIDEVDWAASELNQWVFATCQQHLRQGQRVGLIGGDHSTPLGSILAHAQQYPNLSVLHIDAHSDLRAAYEGFAYSHASIMYNVMQAPRLTRDGEQLPTVAKLVQVGVRDLCEPEYDLIESERGRIKTFFDDALAAERFKGRPFLDLAADVVEHLNASVYVSLDIDGLEPAFCPHTGTPVPGGLHFREVLALLNAVGQSGRRIVGFDVNEVVPGPSDEWDANVAARLIYKLAGHVLSAKRPPSRQRSVGFR